MADGCSLIKWNYLVPYLSGLHQIVICLMCHWLSYRSEDVCTSDVCLCIQSALVITRCIKTKIRL